MLSIDEINLLQAQNEGLKKQNAELQRQNAILKEENYNKLITWEELQADNERLKEENYQLQKDCQICENFIDFIPCKPIRDMDYDLQKVICQRDNYYQTLQEIKAIAENREIFCENCSFCCDEFTCDDCGYVKILQKITKAEEE